MATVDQEFKRLLKGFKLTRLEDHHGSVYGLWPDFRLAYVNPAWFRFAEENGGEPDISTRWSLGASFLDAFPSVVVSYYETSCRSCLETGERWEHRYECSSRHLYRQFHQIVYPLDGSGLLVVNSLVVEQPHDEAERPPQNPDESVYRDEDGLLNQCAHCRRVQNVRSEQRWDWVPEWVEKFPEKTSHSFCPTCLGYYYAPG